MYIYTYMHVYVYIYTRDLGVIKTTALTFILRKSAFYSDLPFILQF